MEYFHTIQGEGFHTGRSAFFIRLGGCDVGCVWCDVKESWDVAAHPKISTEKLIDFVKNSQAEFVVITGGEPAMHDLTDLTNRLRNQQIYSAIETSGCYPLLGEIDWYCFSPKKFKAPCNEAYEKANELKVIINHKSDLEWAEMHAEKVSKDCLLYLQPEWSNLERNTEWIVSYVKSNPKWKISLQTHKYMNIP
jgi:7-carboxy-7-deazaguanine synthase